MRKARLVVALFVALAALTSAIAPAWATSAAAQPKVAMTARGGFGDEGSFIMGDWFPIHVALTNPAGGSNMRVRVEVDALGASVDQVMGTYVREVDLPSPSRKEVTLHTYSGNFTHGLDVRLVQGSREIARSTVKLNPLERASNLIMGVISSDRSLLNTLKGEKLGYTQTPFSQNNPYGSATNPVSVGATIAHVDLADVPALPMALDSLDILLIDDVDTGALQAEQRNALADWVARGGTLVTTSRPGGADTLAGLSDISPATVSGTRNLSSLKGLADLTGVPITTTGSILAAGVALRTGQHPAPRVLAMQDGVPLLAIRDLGSGRVMHLAVSPGVAPLKGWDGVVPLFKRMLAEHAVRSSTNAFQRTSSYYGGYYGKLFSTNGGLFDMPGLQLPDPLLIGCFLWLYIMIIAPVNFIVLRRMRRTELAWVTIPALVVVFSIASYALAFQSKGGDLVAIRATIVNTEEGVPRATVAQYLGLFSPYRSTYTLQASGNTQVSEINPYGYYGGPAAGNPLRVSQGPATTAIDNVRINTWSLRALVSESTVAAQSPLEADIHVGDNVVEGTVRNRSGSELRDVALVHGAEVQYIGNMAPGQRAEVKLTVSSRPFNPGSPTSVLPLPPGLNDPTSQNTYPYYGGSVNSVEQRAYNRRVEVLNAALQPMVTTSPPSKPEVLALAWGPAPTAPTLSLVGVTARNEDLNLWTSRLPIGASGNTRPVIKAGAVPLSIYAPGNNIEWTTTRPSLTSFNIDTDRYADITYRLPSGTQPDRLILHYSTSFYFDSASGVSGEFDMLVHNPYTGVWERLETLTNENAMQVSTISFANPKDYVGPGGDVLVRLLPKSRGVSLTLQSFDLGLNETP